MVRSNFYENKVRILEMYNKFDIIFRIKGIHMRKICSKCGKTIEYNLTCTCRTYNTYNRNVSPEKCKFYSF